MPVKKVCLLAAENDALAGAKVGGLGDVLRDLPRALATEGIEVTVLVPSYGRLHKLPGATRHGVCTTRFRGLPTRIELYSIDGAYGDDAVAARIDTRVLHHPDFDACGDAGGATPIYCDDSADRPFARDASKFALFSAAALDAITAGTVDRPDALHLHDWHTGLAAVLREYDPHYASLCAIPLIYSVHNLALQGIRPFAEDASSLEAWFPHLDYDASAIADPRWSDCVNPVAAAIRLADRVHTVSPTHAREVLRPNDPAVGFHGGEGLEADLVAADAAHRLVGILNGIDYPDRNIARAVPATARADGSHDDVAWQAFASALAGELLGTLGRDGAAAPLRASDYLAHQRALEWRERPRPQHLLTSVGRLVEQKIALLFAPLDDGRPALDHLLKRHADDSCLVLIGSGEPHLEDACLRLAARHPSLLFVNRYAQGLADLAFAHGDLFLMPSSFEPCGISQMLAMRAGQPCLVHAVGGLADTIEDGIDGFAFNGTDTPDQARALLERLDTTLELHAASPQDWQAISDAAAARRFDWATSARLYLTELYTS